MKKDKRNKSKKSIRKVKTNKLKKSIKKRQSQKQIKSKMSKSTNHKNKTLKGGKDTPTPKDFNHVIISNPEGKNSALSSSNSSYNDNLFVRESHNCYTYFLNLKNKDAVELCKKDFNKNNYCPMWDSNPRPPD